MPEVIEPALAVLSGPLARRSDCARTLEASGFKVLDPEPLPEDPSEHPPHRGLPSYRNPHEAIEAGKPNSGHTPGTPHPEPHEAEEHAQALQEHVGSDYEPDPRISFLDVELPQRGPGEALDQIVRLAEENRYGLRIHYSEHVITQPPALSVDERLEIAEAHLVSIRMDRLRASGVPLAAMTSPPYALQQSSHGAQLFREATSSLVAPAGGIVQSQDFAITQNGTPNMSVNIGAGRIWVPNTYLATVNPGGGAYYPGGLYYAESDAAVNLAISASNPTNPRLDQGIAQIQDAAYSGSTNSAQLAILTGTPTAGAALNNLVGLASLPASSLLLGYALVPANATSIVTANIANAAIQATTGVRAEYGYDQITSSVTVSSATEASGTTVIACAAHTFDGSTVMAEFFSEGVLPAVSDSIIVSLFEGSTQIGRIATVASPTGSNINVAVVGKLRFAPTSGSHTYTVTAFRGSANGTISAGPGGTGAAVPAYIRFTKA